MAKEFSLVSDPNVTVFKNVVIASQAYQIGDLMQISRSAATVTPATSSTINANVYAVAMGAALSTDIAVLACLIMPQQVWGADNTNTPNVAHNMQRMVLTDKGTVNNTGTDSASSAAVWTQTGVLTGNRTTGNFNIQASVA